jgi:hypothetical protein
LSYLISLLINLNCINKLFKLKYPFLKNLMNKYFNFFNYIKGRKYRSLVNRLFMFLSMKLIVIKIIKLKNNEMIFLINQWGA